MNTSQLQFISQGTRCAGTLKLPKQNRKPPVIIMAQGFGMIKDAGLPKFAERFVAQGYAVFSFDYRGFGDSEGHPRHWVSPKRHLEDWKAALNFVRTLDSVDTQQIILWGYSFSGGHAIQTAARDGQVKAVILQAPHVDGLSSLKGVPLSKLAKLSAAGFMDLLGGLLNKPVYRPIIGRENDIAAMTTADAWDGYLSQLPENAKWENKTRARIFLEIAYYNPTLFAHKLSMPVVVISGQRDSIIPEQSIRSAANKMPNAEYYMLNSNHFELCDGELFEQNIALQIDFLKKHCPAHAELTVAA
ncbi:alpha/beta hydrolase [Acinetobacter zhairhuonensis]|uniref:alpha/beta hydrolase n=1 Tax=Acinetobacter sp. A7.4 TaxID=2919921 RepID=UPI001F50053E|nr:alpha/beta fold hydrolase [Acinetobacter sp. A7.4]MCJ8162647.1 alpha/beta fold hydrolase [Acinetobacter sp. A7.4]